ncbi:MAG: S8 family serine peptidase [Halorubrum sp.]
MDSEPYDDSGHGTHVSGTVTGAEDPDGVDESFGVAPDVELYHGAAIPGGSGSFTQVAAAMEWAVDDAEADIVTMSLGSDGYNTDMIEPSENARDAGVVLVASAGNSGDGVTGSPGNVYPNFASGAVDENADVASFSGGEEIDTDSAWGDDAPDYWPDEYVVPNAAAPGVNILSSVPDGGYDDTYSGTSMSAPHKAGAFALMHSAAGGNVDRETLRDAMEETAWKPDDADEPEGVPDTRYGYGIIDVKAATDQVALDSGVNGTVTDTDGEPVEGATVEIEESDTEVTTDANGSYTALAEPGNYTVTASGFGYETASETVDVENETFTEQDFELDDGLGVELSQGQPEAIEGGESFDVEVDVANLETYSVERNGSYDGDLTLELNGDEIEEGEDVDLGGISGEATLTVTTEENTEGDLALDHAFSGEGETVEVTTGPTDVFAEYTEIAVVDDSTFGEDVVDRLEDELPGSYEIDLLTSSEAIDAAENDEHAAYVVQNIDDANVEDFDDATAGPSPGVVWLDQWGGSSNGVPARADALEDPASTDDGFAAPNPELEIAADHPVFDGVGEPGDTFPIHSADFADSSWYEGYSGETVGHVQSGSVTDGDAVGVDDESRTILLSSFGSSTFVGPGDYSGEADAVLANSVEYATTEPDYVLTEEMPAQADPGELFGGEFDVNEMEKIRVSLHEDSTATEEELDLYLGDSVNAFDEWRAYDPPTDGEYPVEIESDDESVGSVILEVEFDFAEDGNSTTEPQVDAETTIGPTAVYDEPLTVGDDGQVDTIQEAVDLAPDGATIEVGPGEYNETLSIEKDNLTITGDNATIVPPDSGADDGHAHVDVQGDGTQFEGFSLETPEGLAGVGVSDAENVTVHDVAVDGAGDGVQVVDSEAVEVSAVESTGAAANGVHAAASTDVTVDNATATDADTGVLIADSTDATVDAPYAVDSGTGVAVNDSASVDVHDATVENASGHGVHLDGAEMAGVHDATVEGAADAGVASMDSDEVSVAGATVMDAEHGIAVAGGMVDEVTDNNVDDAEHGIAVQDNAEAADVSDNEVANATHGFLLTGAGTSASVMQNHVDAETGATVDGVTGEIEFNFNDLESTETAIANDGDDGFDAPLNWFGEDGPQASNGVEGDVRYSPYLTADLDTVDMNTTQIAVDLTMEANETYTVGVPAASDQTVGDVFEDEFEGAIYGYDAEIGEWQMLSEDDDVSALSALLVTAEEDTYATLDFQSSDDPSSPGQVELHDGWNLVSPSAYHHEEFAFWTDGTSNEEYYTPSTWMQAHEHADGHLGENTVDMDSAVNPFGGYWVGIGAEDDGYNLFADMEQDPTMNDYYDLTDPEVPDVPEPPEDDPGDEPEDPEPEDVDVAVVDEEDHFEGEIADYLEGELDDDTYDSVDTLTADELLDEMGEYDVFVVQRLGDDDLVADFEDELGDDQAVVYLDSYQGATSEAYADGVYRLNNEFEDPSERDSVSLDADSEPVEVDVESDHPIFDGVGDEGESVPVVDSGTTWGAWFDGYSGQVVGHSDFSPSDDGEFEGPGVAVAPGENVVLNTAIAMDYFHDDPDDFTAEGATLFTNSVDEAAQMSTTSSTGDNVLEEEEDDDGQASVDAPAAPAVAPA